MLDDFCLDLLEQFSDQCIWVVGDIMLDSYTSGTIKRLSPEAPVQVIDVDNEFNHLGGAGNVAEQLSGLGAQSILIGYLGKDSEAKIVLDLCLSSRINAERIVFAKNKPTIHKFRVLANHQQMMRLDWENRAPLDLSLTEEILTGINRLPRPSAIILSDYCKGTITPFLARSIIKKALDWNIPVIVDTKSRSLVQFKGVSGLTPNLTELSSLVGADIDAQDDEVLINASRDLAARTSCQWVLITLGPHGIALWDRMTEVFYRVPSEKCQARDVTGAGDTVVATFATALSSGASLLAGAKIANLAASIAVSKVGTVTISISEIANQFIQNDTERGKIVSFDEISHYIRLWKTAGKRIVFTNGCFDLLHTGHVSLLRQARELGDILIVGLNSDNSVRQWGKGLDRPFIPERERAEVLAALSCVDAIVLFREDTPLKLIEHIIPQVLVKGKDYQDKEVIGQVIVEKHGGRVVLLDLIPGCSTSAIMKRIHESRS